MQQYIDSHQTARHLGEPDVSHASYGGRADGSAVSVDSRISSVRARIGLMHLERERFRTPVVPNREGVPTNGTPRASITWNFRMIGHDNLA
jgi:hypothetical protein